MNLIKSAQIPGLNSQWDIFRNVSDTLQPLQQILQCLEKCEINSFDGIEKNILWLFPNILVCGIYGIPPKPSEYTPFYGLEPIFHMTRKTLRPSYRWGTEFKE